MSAVAVAIAAFDRWLRDDFRRINTALEEAAFAGGGDAPDGPQLRSTLLDDGSRAVAAIARSGSLPAADPDRYELLGMLGFLMAACHRHGVDQPDAPATDHPLADTWALSIRLGDALGVVPRYVFAHQAFHSRSVRDDYRTFTLLADERAFTEANGLAVLAYRRAAAALRRIPAMGVSHPMAAYELDGARAALEDVLRFDQAIVRTVGVERFFRNIRPYFKPHRVGDRRYRGTNAGDFSAINEIDLHLGVVSGDDPTYGALLEEKRRHVPPEDQSAMRDAGAIPSLLDAFVHEVGSGSPTPQLRANAERFLGVWRAHGAAYAYHHTRLVKPYLQRPAETAPPEEAGDLTASGPPLDEVVDGLQRLRDLRTATDRPDRASARERLDVLRRSLA